MTRRLRPPPTPEDLGQTYAVTQRVHFFNPTPPPPEPPLIGERPSGATPVAWATQCRSCWGWYDDWRHYTPIHLSHHAPQYLGPGVRQ